MTRVDLLLNCLQPAHCRLNWLVGCLTYVLHRILMLIFHRLYDLSDWAQALLQLVHESFLSIDLSLVVLLLVLPQQSKSRLQPLPCVLFCAQSKCNFIFNLLVQAHNLLLNQHLFLFESLLACQVQSLLIVSQTIYGWQTILPGLANSLHKGFLLFEYLSLNVLNELWLFLLGLFSFCLLFKYSLT